MKKTCKTRKYRDFLGNCWKTKDLLDADRRDDTPACEHWELRLDDLVDAMDTSVAKARKKHPVLLDVWPEPNDAEHYKTDAKIWKQVIARQEFDQLRSVIYSEVNEFLAEVARGDFDRAIREAGDIMAVLYRTLNGEGRDKRTEGTK